MCSAVVASDPSHTPSCTALRATSIRSVSHASAAPSPMRSSASDVDVEGQVGRRLAVGRVDGVDRHAAVGGSTTNSAAAAVDRCRRPPRARRAGRTGRLASTRRGDSRPSIAVASTDGSAIVLAPDSASALVSTISPAAAPATIAAPRSPANSARASAVTTDGTSGTGATVRPCWVAIRLSATIPMPLPPARSGKWDGEQAGVGELPPQVAVEAVGGLDRLHPLGGREIGEELRGEVADDLLLLGEVEVHSGLRVLEPRSRTRTAACARRRPDGSRS